MPDQSFAVGLVSLPLLDNLLTGADLRTRCVVCPDNTNEFRTHDVHPSCHSIACEVRER